MSSAYYTRLSRIAMRNHGLNSENHARLARWAQYAAAHRYTNRGVLVTGDGRLHAETIHPTPPPPDPLARRTEWKPLPPWQINARTWRGPGEPPTGTRALSDAMDTIKEATGLPLAHIVYREVCTGWAGSDVEQNPTP